MIVELGFLVGFLILGPAVCWLVGTFNPMGYLGVPPWQVPKCTCDGTSARNHRLSHDEECPRPGFYDGPRRAQR